MPEELLGTLIKDRYRLDSELGSGGFGTVYLAHDTQLRDRPVVVKVLHDRVKTDEWFQRKFSEEIEALSRIHHPGVVAVMDTGTLDTGQPYMVQQFVEGSTLRQSIKPGGMDLPRAASILRKAGQALSAAHERKILHRDLKPENIMLNSVSEGEEHVTLIDFGIASVLDDSEPEKTKVTGTFSYMAPEQFDGKPLPASDTYALGVIAFEMLAGVPPSFGRPLFEVMLMQKEGSWPKIHELRPSVSLRTQELILQALSHDPSKRFISAREFGDAIARALTEPETVTELPGPPPIALSTPAPQPSRFSGRLIVWVLAAVAIAALTAAITIWRDRQQKQASSPPTQPIEQVRAVPPPIAGAADLEVSYWITVVGKKESDSYILPHERIFRQGEEIRFQVESQKPGFLYIVNQAATMRGGLPEYSMLFPSQTANRGSARLEPGTSVRIPEKSTFAFHDAVGMEYVWLIWSETEVPTLDGIPASDGSLSESVRKRIFLFLKDNEAAKPTVEISAASARTILKRPGRLLVQRIDFSHTR